MRVQILRAWVVVVVVAALTACGEAPNSSEPAPTSTAQPVAEAQPPAATDERTGASAEQLLARAGSALAEERLFEPPGDNALELYLAVIAAAEPKTEVSDSAGTQRRGRLTDAMAGGDRSTQALQALNDLFPYGVIWAERAIARGDREAALRVIAGLERVRPGSDSLERLRRGVRDAEQAAANAAATAAAAVARPAPRPAAPAASSAPPPAAPSGASLARAEPVATPASASPTAVSPPPAPATPNPTAPDNEPAAAPATTAPAVAAPAASGVPELLAQVNPRYPARAQRQKIEGWVALRFVIQPDGSVDDIEVIGAEPEGVFEREAIGAVRRWQYRAPGRDVVVERRIDFLLGR